MIKQSPKFIVTLVGCLGLTVTLVVNAKQYFSTRSSSAAPPAELSPSRSPEPKPATPALTKSSQLFLATESTVSATSSPTSNQPLTKEKLEPKAKSVSTKAPVPAAKTAPEPSKSKALALPTQADVMLDPARFSTDASIEMRVAIAEKVEELTIASTTPAVIIDQSGQPLQQLAPRESYRVQKLDNRIQFGSWQLPPMILIEPLQGGMVSLNGNLYRGRMLVVIHEGGLWGINAINLRHYLHSVVGSEVSPSWPEAALKAQAVAARSYGLVYYFRPVSKFYHLAATEYYQVYKGISSEADSIRKAVDETAGEFVSYRGGIVESLYAASDDIVAEAFQGMGMSQLGALDMANKGYSYQNILHHYYPNTGVSRIALDME